MVFPTLLILIIFNNIGGEGINIQIIICFGTPSNIVTTII